jgi:carboxypeptidase Q
MKTAALLIFFSSLGLSQDMATKIKTEAMEHSQVASVFEMLTVNIGPRLTASPAHKRAAEYARDILTSYGLVNARLEPWHFGRGWTLEKLTLEMTEPRYLPLIGYADGWSPSTLGEIEAAPLWIAGKTTEQLPPMKNAIVMTDPMMTSFIRKDRPNPSDPDYQPMSAAYATSVGGGGRGRGGNAATLAQVIRAAAPGVILKPSRGEHGTVFVTGRDGGAGAIPTVTLAAEHYDMIVDLIKHNVPVKLRVNVQTKFYDNDNGNAYNVIAEIPGSDPVLKDEVVMIGGHLDSWHTGVGATDNADGSTTVMEAMRILKAVGAKPRRTIRVALWGGEEQGLLGSKAWVENHRNEAPKIDVYFNIDNGTNKIYGFYLQNVEAVHKLFDEWLEPMKSIGARRNVIEPVGSTDHLSFIEAGIPGFNPIQDYQNYDIRTHHTNMDTNERLEVNDIREAAAVMAWFAYSSAMQEPRIPRPVVNQGASK